MEMQDPEQIVIGMALQEPKLVDEILAAQVTPPMFERPECLAIWKALLKAPRELADFTLVYNQLADEAHKAAALAYYTEAPPSQSVAYHCRAIRTRFLQRKIGERLSIASKRLLAMNPYDGPSALRTMTSWIGEGLDFDEDDDRGLQISSGARVLSDEIEVFLTSKENRDFITTGIDRLDTYLGGGFERGTYNLLAARPSVGKTSVSLQMALAAAQSGAKVLYISNEMSARRIIRKAMGALGDFDLGKFRDKQWTERDTTKFLDTVGKAQEINFLEIWDRSQSSAEKAVAYAQATHHRVGLDLIVIDYLQDFRTARNQENLHREYGDVSNMFKTLVGKHKETAVLVLAQINRAADDCRPRLKDLAECGYLERHGDNIMFLHRLAPERSDMAPPIELLIAKNREGERRALRMRNDMHFGKITDIGIPDETL
jgi:replicative DNA helicase